jgi:two-component system, OmpR family, response regulator ChvI
LTLKTDPIRVLFVEDDKNYREIVGDELSYHGFAVHSFADGDALLGSLDAGADADVIVLDWALPTISGIDLLPELRRHGVNLPVVFLTSHAKPAYEQLAFERGALDFIDKMRGVDILARRLRLAAESGKVEPDLSPQRHLVCGKLVLGLAGQRAYWNAVDVGLTVTEYDVVHLLVSNAGRYLTYREIYDRMHYTGFVAGFGDEGFRTNVRAIIKRIRRKFCELDPTFGGIENGAALGYRWRELSLSAG